VSFNDLDAEVNFGVILGNEGEGVKRDLVKERRENVSIGIYGKGESLNVGIGGSMLMYEVKG
ncbi:TrmH family RNA methyltransferase, partial [Staphylococcus epidermidis]|uniref:TrmH family RNA methyltransferase n=1 Tax=Staphylococcus epidermidis TaxID=1282 RepID=UPI0011A1ABE5